MTMSPVDETHSPDRVSWVESANEHPDFPIQNLPLGIFSIGDEQPRGGVAIGDRIVDLAELARTGLLQGEAQIAAVAGTESTLNKLLSLGAEPRRALRRALSELLSNRVMGQRVEHILCDAAEARLHLPVRIGDYTDFYVGIHHAANVGKLFRPDNPLLPNYKYIPIGYHGRASSVRVSGTPVVRPNGQRLLPGESEPSFGPARRLDYELELGVWISQGNDLGSPIAIGNAPDHVAGLSLLNDWSARDIQAWEYQPLGPFLAKNFLTTVSPWIVTSEALAPFRIAQVPRAAEDPRPLPYLWNEEDQRLGAFAIDLEVRIATAKMRVESLAPHRLSRGPASTMYWTIAQMIAHHTSNGCNLNPGDLLGSGTISTPDRSGFGSLLELSEGGKSPVDLPNGQKRAFLEDGDEIILSARAEAEGFHSIGFGPCVGVVQPAACTAIEG